MVRLIERIKSFSVTSPLMRYVTGLEMVLQASQLWDRDAATSFKLTVQLEQVVKLIKHWRNIEYRLVSLSFS
jgi:midasin